MTDFISCRASADHRTPAPRFRDLPMCSQRGKIVLLSDPKMPPQQSHQYYRTVERPNLKELQRRRLGIESMVAMNPKRKAWGDDVGREMDKETPLREVSASLPKTEASFFSLVCKRLNTGCAAS